MSELFPLRVVLFPFAVVLLGGVLWIISWASITTGQLFMRLLRDERIESQTHSRWDACWLYFGIYLLTDLLPDPFTKHTYSENLLREREIWSYPLGVVLGIILYGFGLRSCTWKTAAVAAIPIAGWTWYGITSQNEALNAIALVLYAASCAVFVFLVVKLLRGIGRLRDEIISDWNDEVISPAMRVAFKILETDAETLKESPTYSRFTMISGWIKNSANLEAAASAKGLLVRIPVGEQDTYFYFSNPDRAVWFCVPWENLEVIKFDRIIGHTEIRLRLRNSGHELVLVHPPKNIEKYLPELKTSDGHHESAAATSI